MAREISVYSIRVFDDLMFHWVLEDGNRIPILLGRRGFTHIYTIQERRTFAEILLRILDRRYFGNHSPFLCDGVETQAECVMRDVCGINSNPFSSWLEVLQTTLDEATYHTLRNELLAAIRLSLSPNV